MNRRGNGTLAWAAIDLVTCLLLVVYTLIAPPPKPHKPPRIETIGTYAVVLEWSGKNSDDVDLWVEDPKDNIVYFENSSAGLMNLEHDDIPDVTESTGTRAAGNHERTLIRGVETGEYTVNVHMYRKVDKGPTTVKVTLWKLRGEDRAIHTQTVTLTREGDEQTAFRFVVNQAGNVTSYDRLPKKLIGNGGGTAPPVTNLSSGSPAGGGTGP